MSADAKREVAEAFEHLAEAVVASRGKAPLKPRGGGPLRPVKVVKTDGQTAVVTHADLLQGLLRREGVEAAVEGKRPRVTVCADCGKPISINQKGSRIRSRCKPCAKARSLERQRQARGSRPRAGLACIDCGGEYSVANAGPVSKRCPACAKRAKENARKAKYLEDLDGSRARGRARAQRAARKRGVPPRKPALTGEAAREAKRLYWERYSRKKGVRERVRRDPTLTYCSRCRCIPVQERKICDRCRLQTRRWREVAKKRGQL